MPAAVDHQPDELVSIIRDHEYVHARDWFAGIPISPQLRISEEEALLLDPNVIISVMEVRAYRHQLNVMSEELKSRFGIYLSTSSGYNAHRHRLQRALEDPRSSFEEKVIREFLSNLDQMI